MWTRELGAHSVTNINGQFGRGKRRSRRTEEQKIRRQAHETISSR